MDWLPGAGPILRPAGLGCLVDSQSKRDLIAGAAILAMFIGAFTLTVSSLGLFLIVGGAIVMLFLFVTTSRTKQ